MEDLKLRMPSPRLFPSAANLLGPKSNSTMARMKRISVRPILPSTLNPPQNCASLSLKARPLFGRSSRSRRYADATQYLGKILGYMCGGVKECASYGLTGWQAGGLCLRASQPRGISDGQDAMDRCCVFSFDSFALFRARGGSRLDAS